MTLFEKLGGQAAVSAAVDIFYTKVLADPVINHFFKDIDMKAQARKQKMFMTYAFGGMPNYDGKSMREAHKHLKLTDEHFNAVAGHLQATLQELDVPPDLQRAVMDIVGSTHDDVLNL